MKSLFTAVAAGIMVMFTMVLVVILNPIAWIAGAIVYFVVQTV